MSQTISYTFYLPYSSDVYFPINYITLPTPQSQIYSQTQLTRQIQSTPDASTALGLGTASSIKTVIIDQQGQNNYICEGLLNFNGEANGETGGDIPPKGVLAYSVSLLNQTTVPTSATNVSVIIIPPGQSSITSVAVINTSLSSGAYFGATGIIYITNYADETIPRKFVVEGIWGVS